MFKSMQQLAAAAFCALALVAAAAPAQAQSPLSFTARAGEVRLVESDTNPTATQALAAEFVGLIHVVTIDPATQKLAWTLRTRDNVTTLAQGPAEFDAEFQEVYAWGTIATGPLAGAEVDAMGYREGGKLMLDIIVSTPNAEIWFVQPLELLQGTLPQ